MAESVCPRCGYRVLSEALVASLAILGRRLEQTPGHTLQERMQNLNLAPELSDDEVRLVMRVRLQAGFAREEARHAARMAEFSKQLDAIAASDPALKAWLDEGIDLPDEHVREADRRARDLRALQVKPIRQQLGLTQAQAARRMGVVRTTVVAIEQGKRGVSEAELEALQREPEHA